LCVPLQDEPLLALTVLVRGKERGSDPATTLSASPSRWRPQKLDQRNALGDRGHFKSRKKI